MLADFHPRWFRLTLFAKRFDATIYGHTVTSMATSGSAVPAPRALGWWATVLGRCLARPLCPLIQALSYGLKVRNLVMRVQNLPRGGLRDSTGEGPLWWRRLSFRLAWRTASAEAPVASITSADGAPTCTSRWATSWP
jgi:hypothetical protein